MKKFKSLLIRPQIIEMVRGHHATSSNWHQLRPREVARQLKLTPQEYMAAARQLRTERIRQALESNPSQLDVVILSKELRCSPSEVRILAAELRRELGLGAGKPGGRHFAHGPDVTAIIDQVFLRARQQNSTRVNFRELVLAVGRATQIPIPVSTMSQYLGRYNRQHGTRLRLQNTIPPVPGQTGMSLVIAFLKQNGVSVMVPKKRRTR